MTEPRRRPRMFLAAPILLALAAGGVSLRAQDDPLAWGASVPAGAVAVLDGEPIPLSEFLDEMVVRYRRPSESASGVRELLIKTALVRSELRARGLQVDAREVEAKLESLRARLAQAGQSLEGTLQKENVSLEQFRRTLRQVVGLEKLVRADAKLPPDTEPNPLRQQVWLTDRLKDARIDSKPANPEYFAVVNDEPITIKEYVREAMQLEDRKKIRRVVETLIQDRLAKRLLALHGLTLTEGDLELEFRYQKERFEERPEMKGVHFEDIVKQTTGMEVAEWRQSRAFRIKAAAALLGRRAVTQEKLLEGYEAHKGAFGPKLHVQHILIRASDERGAGPLPSFDVAEKRIARILQELLQGAHFEDRARLYSEDQASKFSGGRIPAFTPGDERYDPDFRRAAAALEPGLTSQPVRSRAGVHLIKMVKRDPVPSVAEIEPDLRHILGEQYFRDRYNAANIGIHVRESELR